MSCTDTLRQAAAEASRRFPADRIGAVAFIRDRANADARTALRALDNIQEAPEEPPAPQRAETAMNGGFDPGFWPSRMRRDGVEATAHQLAAAWRAWSGGSYHSLMVQLSRSGATAKPHSDFGRLADGMLQRARKKGIASYDGRRWVLTQASAPSQ